MLFITAVTNYLQAALIGALAFAAPDVAAPEVEDEGTEEAVERRALPCSMSGNTSTGRQWGMISDTTTPGQCVRWATGGTAPQFEPSCGTVGRSQLGCTNIETVPPR